MIIKLDLQNFLDKAELRDFFDEIEIPDVRYCNGCDFLDSSLFGLCGYCYLFSHRLDTEMPLNHLIKFLRCKKCIFLGQTNAKN